MEKNKQREIRDNTDLVRKPVKKKTIPVRQTLTSYARMLKANPLLQFEENGINIDDLLRNKSTNIHAIPDSISSVSKTTNKNLNGFKKPEVRQETKPNKVFKPSSNWTLNSKKITIISGNRPQTCDLKPSINYHKNRETISSKYFQNKIQDYQPIIEVKSKVNSFRKASSSNDVKAQQNHVPAKKKCTLRRSLSSDNIQKKGKYFAPKIHFKKPNRTCSEDDLFDPPQNANRVFTPLAEETSMNNPFIFKTPSAHERRSICHFTPMSGARKLHFFKSTSTPFPVDRVSLQERLDHWLKSRGKEISSFHHLKCFDISHVKKIAPPPVIDEENKENIEVLNEKYESYENLNIIGTPQKVNGDAAGKDTLSDEDISKLAKEALVELHNLIQEEYPTILCLDWLELIRSKYEKIDEEPEYWECRAAIEQSSGNVGKAVEYYKTAIIQGAEVKTVDKSLDQLLKKFSLLNISPNKSEVAKIDKEKERIIKEARNVFKSTIIQFAIQEKKLKKNNLEGPALTKLKATPVRRSTRLSRSGYITTPGVKLCMSLKEIENSIDIDFEKNKALC